MSTLQAIALGAMMVCTPSLIFLTWVLWKAPPSRSCDEGTSSHPMGDRITADILPSSAAPGGLGPLSALDLSLGRMSRRPPARGSPPLSHRSTAASSASST
jgi:hypothetical protein